MRVGPAAAVLVSVAMMASGCKAPQSRTDQAVAQAKELAAQSGVAQQVVWTDVAGNTIKVVVQPPAPGQTQQNVTRSVGKTPGDPSVLAPVTNSPSGPVISPVGSPVAPPLRH
jgi:hypothetical protein